MVIRVKCTCGTSLKIPSTAADKVIKCPSCAKKFRVPAAKFKSHAESPAAKEPGRPNPTTPRHSPAAAQSKPSAGTPSPEPVPVNLDDQLLNIADDVIGFSDRDLLSAAIDSQSAPSVPVQPPAAVPVGGPAEAPTELGYAQDPVRMARSRVAQSVTGGPLRSFWVDLAHAFIFPFATVGNALNTIFLIGLNFAGSFTWLGIFVTFYMAAVYMNVVGDTASGSDDYKAATLEGGVWEAVLKPFLHFIGTMAVALIPMGAYLVLVYQGVMEGNPVMFILWTGLGIFIWPILVLLAATEMTGVLATPHLIAETIAKTILPYLAIWLLLLVAVAFLIMTTLGASLLEEIGLGSRERGVGVFGFFGGRIAGEAGSVLTMIISMRLIGLYYLHFKHKFAFKME